MCLKIMNFSKTNRAKAYERLRNYVNYECYNGYDVPEEEIQEEINKIESGYYD